MPAEVSIPFPGPKLERPPLHEPSIVLVLVVVLERAEMEHEDDDEGKKGRVPMRNVGIVESSA